MLTFTCDICGTSYKAHLGGRVGNYESDSERVIFMDDTEPCKACKDAAEEAKKNALEARKKKE